MVNQEQIGDSEHSPLKRRILDVSYQWTVAGKISKPAAWQILERRLNVIAVTGKTITLDFALLLRIAASLSIVALAAYFVYLQFDVEVFTKRGEHKLVTLPDHSTVMLNAASSLHYNKLMFGLARNVTLDGEGFFTITKGNRFTAASKSATVEVLGTQFNLMSTADKYEVACTEGKVRISNNKRDSNVILIAGQYTALHNAQFDAPSKVKEENISWKKGEFYFENASLPEVFKTLSLQYDIRIQIEIANPSARHYTGYFTKNNLNEALDLICVPLSLQYKMLGPSEVKILPNKKLTNKPKSK
ncbi:MAG TPA: FecR domain-containing protein [Chryseolinea sp.]|nr:FecR domain-containing protein [Chryseolinea sp.]